VRDRALRAWITMYDSIPREVDLPTEAVPECRHGRSRWEAEWARHRLVWAARTGDVQLLRDGVLPQAVRHLPSISLGLWRGLVRRLRSVPRFTDDTSLV
jgi:hypothetical protein